MSHPARRAFGVPVAVMSLALACITLAGCTPPGATPREAGTDTPAERTAEWSITPSARLFTAQAIGSHIVVVHEHGVAVLDRKSGEERWSTAAEFPNRHQPAEHSVRVTADALVLLREPDKSEDPGTATVYDLATGEERATLEYRSDGLAEAAVTAEALLVQTAEPTTPGDRPSRSTLQSVDLRTGRTLWKQEYAGGFLTIQQVAHSSNPLFGPPRRDPLLAPESTVVLLRGRLKPRDEERTWVIDPRTGRTVGAPATPPHDTRVRLLDDRRYVAWADSAARGDCATRVAGYDVATGKQVWGLKAAVWRDGTDPDCSGAWKPSLVEHVLSTHTPGERPVLIDPADGKATWTGPAGFYPVGVSGDVVVGRDSRKDNTLVAFDISSSRQLWTAPDPVGLQGESDTVVPGYAIFASGADEVWTYQLNTGRKLRCAGANHMIAAGEGWLVTGLLGGGKRALRYFTL